MGLQTPASATATSLDCVQHDPEKHASSPYEGKGTDEDPFVVVWLPNDPKNPYNWSPARRWTVTMVAAMTCLVVAFGSSVYAGAAQQLIATYGISSEVFTLGITFYVLGFAFGPCFWAPFSEMWGRRIVFLITYFFFFIFQLGGALAPNIETVLVVRFLTGFFGSAPLTNSGGVVADCFSASDRALAMVAFGVAPWAGPVLGPIVGGYVGQSISWRYIFWILLGFSGVMFVLGALIPETYAPVLLRRKAAKLTEETGLVHVSTYDAKADKNETFLTKLKVNCSRPFVLLFFEPIVSLFAIYTAVVYAMLYMMFGAFPIVFGEARGWKSGASGLPFLAVGLGMLGAIAISGFVVQPAYVRELNANGGRPLPPERRLPICCVGAVALPISLFWFAWTVSPNIHWIVPCLAVIPFGVGQVLLFLPLFNYSIDVYLLYAASALAANAVARSILGAVLPLATRRMFHAMGNEWALTFLGFLSLLFAPVPFFFIKYGAQIRKRSRFAPGHRESTPQDDPEVTKEIENADKAQDEAERRSIAEHSKV